MSQEISDVTETVKAIGGLKDKAKRIRDRVDKNIKSAHEMLDKVDQGIAEPLEAAVTDLSLLLSTTTNAPPKA